MRLMTSKMSKLVCILIATITLGVLSGIHGSSLYKYQPVLTIKTEKGQKIDCVDFYKQPAFINSSTTNHIPKEKLISLQSQGGKAKEPNFLGLKNGCPFGTVPILRSLNVLNPSITQPNKEGEHCTASIVSTGYGGRVFYGAGAAVSLYKPKVIGSQWSGSRIKLSNGPDSVEAGWMVNPMVFKNSESHLYIKFKAGSKECFNFDCQGFVQVSKDIFIGNHPNQYMHINDKNITYWNINIDQHEDDRNWWLSMYPDKRPVGYWPKSLFTSLAELAKHVEWGGEISNPGLVEPDPYMGSGLTARKDASKSAVFFQMRVDPGFLIPQDTDWNEDCDDFTVADAGTSSDPFWGRLFYYGGPYQIIE